MPRLDIYILGIRSIANAWKDPAVMSLFKVLVGQSWFVVVGEIRTERSK